MKNLSYLILIPLLLTSCSKTVKEVHYPVKDQMPSSVLQTSENLEIESLKKLLNSEKPNLALAKLLSKSLSKKNKKHIQELVADLSAEDIEAIILKFKTDNKIIREKYQFHGEAYRENEELLSQSFSSFSQTENHPFSVESQLRLSALAYIKNQALNNVLKIYDQRVAELADDLAQDIAYDLAINDPKMASDIERALQHGTRSEVISMIQKSRPLIEKLDAHFRSSELKENEQYVVTMSGILAYAIYDKLEEDKGFQKVVAEGKRIIRDVKTFIHKAKEFVVLVNSIEGHIKYTNTNITDLSDGITGAKNDLSKIWREADFDTKGPADVDSKKILSFLYNSMISGEDAPTDAKNPSILSKQISFKANFNKSLKAAGHLADNLSNIIQTTNKLTQLFGIKPSKEVQKVLEKTQKVGQVISTVRSAIDGFATGGFVGAIGALSSGPMATMLGGQSENSLKLEEISRKLDMVLDNQRIMMNIQIDTMNMIKELAVMVDAYHQKEMAALSDLRHYTLVNLEINKAGMNEGIRNCERIVNFQMKSIWNSFRFGDDSFHSIHNLNSLSSSFLGSINGLNDIRTISRNLGEESFRMCQLGIAEAFGGNTIEENPLRSIYSSSGDKNLYTFQYQTYLPLLYALDKFAGTSDFDSIPLHLPVKTVNALALKAPFIDYASVIASSNDRYKMIEMVSVKNLERYLAYLIILNPLIELDKSEWEKTYAEIVGTYLNKTQHRGDYYLQNALGLIQTAIAQEALLAGEPILHKLHQLYVNDIFSNQACAAIQREDFPKFRDVAFICSVRGNNLLLKNLLMYSLKAQEQLVDSFQDVYTEAFNKKNLNLLGQLLNIGISEPIKVAASGDGFAVNILTKENSNISIKLPTPEELKEGKLIYTENLPRLLKMQDVVLEALERVAPIKRDHEGNGLLKLLVI